MPITYAAYEHAALFQRGLEQDPEKCDPGFPKRSCFTENRDHDPIQIGWITV
jgi:hypothetical protein